MLTKTNTVRSSTSTLLTSTQPSNEILFSKDFNREESIKPGNLKDNLIHRNNNSKSFSPTRIDVKQRVKRIQATDSGGVGGRISAKMLLSGLSNALPIIEEVDIIRGDTQNNLKPILKKRRAFFFSGSNEVVNKRLNLNDPSTMIKETKIVRFADIKTSSSQEVPRLLAEIHHVESYKQHNFASSIHENIRDDMSTSANRVKNVCECLCRIY